MRRAENYDDIRPLIDFCKDGRVLEALQWVKDGKPLDPPPTPPKCARKRSPLQYAIDSGCHSMVQVLLEGGAEVEQNNRYDALLDAVRCARFDFIKMLVEHGADVKRVDMREVFYTWDPEIIDYFIEQGADVETDSPLAYALSRGVRTALGVYKRFHERVPDFKRQLDHALRYHCNEGDLKWVSLLLWAGADPYAGGQCDPDYAYCGDDEACAIEYAIISGHLDVVRMKKMPHDPHNPKAIQCLEQACTATSATFAEHLLKRGYLVNDRPDGTSSLVSAIYSSVPRRVVHYNLTKPVSEWEIELPVDEQAVAEKAKILGLILEHGARWRPADKKEYQGMRKAMNQMGAGATLDFVKLMVKHKACERAAMNELFRTESLRVHVWKHIGEISDLIEQLS